MRRLLARISLCHGIILTTTRLFDIKLFVIHQSISLPPLASFVLVNLSLVGGFSDLCSIQKFLWIHITSTWLQEIEMMTSGINVSAIGLQRPFAILIRRQ
jgi:hypothetical protein